MGMLIRKNMEGSHQSNSSSDTHPLRPNLASRKDVGDKSSRSKKKESPCAKNLDHGGVIRVNDDPDHLTVDLSKVLLGQAFARGAYSKVYHGIYNEEAVAVKMVRVDDEGERGGALAVRLEKQYNSEVKLLSRLHHTNVVKFVGACRQSPNYCVVTEYVDEGSLMDYLQKLKRKSLPFDKLVSMALDIARGMEYIHSEGVIHRDLKPENILMDKDFRLKVADFGIACEEAYCDNELTGTYRWMAPEVIKRIPYGRKVDVFSFGLILWTLVAGTSPFAEQNPIEAAVAMADKNLRPLIPKDCPPAMRTLIEQCWALQPDTRPEFWQIVKVLEHFQSSLARDDHKKGLLHWIQKFGHHHRRHHHPNHSLMHKPKCFSVFVKS